MHLSGKINNDVMDVLKCACLFFIKSFDSFKISPINHTPSLIYRLFFLQEHYVTYIMFEPFIIQICS
jgi:hypothetical protein